MTTCGALLKFDPTGSAVGSLPAAVFDPRNVPDWNSQCLACDGATVFHSTQWARVLLETYDWKPFYARIAGAVLPIIEVESWLTGRRGVSLPFTDFCAPISHGKSDFSQLLDAALEIGRARKWKYVEFRSNKELPPNAIASEQFYAHELDLRPGPEAVFERFHGSVRRAIRKAGESGVTVTLSSTADALEAFWRLHNETRRKHGAPPQPFSFMRAIREHLLKEGMGFISLARFGTEPVAACMFLHFGKHAVYKFGASHAAAQHLRGTNAAFWTAIKHLAQTGCSTLHFGRTDMDNEGLRRFKLGWGTGESTLNYFKYDFASETFVRPGEHKNHKLATRVFRTLPKPLLRLIGSMLYRHMG